MTEKHNIEDWFNYMGAAVPYRRGGWCKMKCPYHDDSHASAAVNFDANRFKCHACGVSGDTYDLIMKDRGGTLSEAIEFAQTISSTGNREVRLPNKPSHRLSVNTGALGRRGSEVSLGRGRRSSSRS